VYKASGVRLDTMVSFTTTFACLTSPLLFAAFVDARLVIPTKAAPSAPRSFKPQVLGVVASTKESRAADSKVFNLRGGALVVLDPKKIVKATTILLGAQGLLQQEAPRPILKLYGCCDQLNNESTQFLCKLAGIYLASFAIMSTCVVFAKTTLPTAVLAANAFASYWWLGIILNGEDSKGNFARFTSVSALLTHHMFTSFAMTRGDKFANTIIKIMACLLSIDGVLSVLVPDFCARAWLYRRPKLEDVDKMLFRLVGGSMISYIILSGSMSFFDMDPVKAFGISMLGPVLFLAIGLFVVGDFRQLGVPEGPMWAWLLVSIATIIATWAMV